MSRSTLLLVKEKAGKHHPLTTRFKPCQGPKAWHFPAANGNNKVISFTLQSIIKHISHDMCRLEAESISYGGFVLHCIYFSS